MALTQEAIQEIERDFNAVCEESGGFGEVVLVIQDGELVRIRREYDRKLPPKARCRAGPPGRRQAYP